MKFLVRLRGTSNGIKDLAGNKWEAYDVYANGSALVKNGIALTFPRTKHTEYTSGWGGGGTIYVSYLCTPTANSSLTIPENQDFTVSFWFNLSQQQSYTLVLGTRFKTDGSHFGVPSTGLAVGGSYVYRYVGGTHSTHYTGNLDLRGSLSYSLNTPNHYAVVRKDNVITMYLNGKRCGQVDGQQDSQATAYQGWGELPLIVGWDGSQANNMFTGEVDDICLLDGAVWDDEFIPPTKYLTIHDVIYLTSGEAWGMDSNNTFSRLAEDYTQLTDLEKCLLFTDSGEPDISDLGILAMPINAVVGSVDDENKTYTITALPNGQLVTPDTLTAIPSGYNISLVSVIAKGNVKVAITKDGNVYEVYNFISKEWQTIDIEEIATKGMSSTEVGYILDSVWEEYNPTELGFVFYMEADSVDDVAEVEKVVINYTGGEQNG